MEKSQIQSAVNKFTSIGITCWGAFCRGGNYELRHNGKDTFNILAGDFLVHLKDNDSYENLSRKSQFEINIVPYDNIDYIYPLEIDYLETKALLKSLGVNDPAVDEFLKKPNKMFLNTNSRTMGDGDILDKDGNVQSMTGKSAYIIGADADRRVDKATNKDNKTPLETAKKTWHQVVGEKN